MGTAETVKLPVWTLLLCSAAAFVFFAPALQGLLIYDRLAITDGEWWRLITGNLVHHSPAHFVFNVVALFIAGTLIEARRHPHIAVLFLVSAASIGAVLLVTDPFLRYYGGLSGIVTAAVIYLCLFGLQESGRWRLICAGALVIVGIKIGLELSVGTTVIEIAAPLSFEPVPVSHVTGAAIAILFFLIATRASLLRTAIKDRTDTGLSVRR